MEHAGQPVDALLLLLRAVRANRHGVEAHGQLAGLWSRLGHAEKAADSWSEALRWNSQSKAKIELARILWVRGETRRSAGLVQSVLESSPTDPEALLLRAEMLHSGGKPSEAAEVLRQLGAMSSVEPDIWLRLDQMLTTIGEHQTASDLFSRMAEQLPISGRKILAALERIRKGGQSEHASTWVEQAQRWSAWTESELNEGLRRFAGLETDLELGRLLARRYGKMVRDRLARGGGISWPRRTGGDARRVGILCSRWNTQLADRIADWSSAFRSELAEPRVYAVDQSVDEAAESAFEIVRLGQLSAAHAARWVAEDDCDLLLIDHQAASDRCLEVIASHPGVATLSCDSSGPVACLTDGSLAMTSADFAAVLRSTPAESAVREQARMPARDLRSLWSSAVHGHRSGHQAVEADRVYSTILSDQGSVPRVLYMRGSLRRDHGSLRAAAADFSAALLAEPQYLDAGVALIQVLTDLGEYEEASEKAQQILGQVVDDARLWRLLGIAARRSRRQELAMVALQRATEIGPGDAQNWFHLGMAAQGAGDELRALDAFQKAAVLDQQTPEVFYNLAALYFQREDWARAASCYEQVIRLDPNNARAYKNLGDALFATGNLAAWIENFKRFESRCSGSFLLAVQALEVCQFTGEWGRLDHYLNGLQHQRFQPSDVIELVDGLEELLYLLLFVDFDPIELGRFYQTYAHAAAKVYGPPRPRPGDRRPGRLRVGYVSGDLRDHVMGKMIYQWLKHHDREQFEVFLFSTRPVQGVWGQRISESAEHFEDISTLNDAAAVDRISAADLDLLVDCSTHTRGARQGILAAKPARVQVTSIASAGSTGLPTIDYKLTDQLADLPEMQQHQVEPFLVISGCVYPYRHIAPAAAHVYHRERLGIPADAFVIGAFVNILKLSRRCLGLWREILDRVPSARIALSPVKVGQREAYAQIFRAAGIASDRLVFIPQGKDESENQARYSVIDVVVDPMPFGGANGTIEALDMGVPVVTLCGRRHGERVGTSILSNLGVTSTIAHSGPQYVDLVRRLAEDEMFREEVRAQIKAGLVGSEFVDDLRHVRNLEAAYTAAIRQERNSKIDDVPTARIDEH